VGARGTARRKGLAVSALLAALVAAGVGPARADELRFSVFEDSGGRLDFQAVHGLPDHRFRPVAGRLFVGGYSRSVFWLRIRVVRPAGRILEAGAPFVDHATLHYFDAQGHAVRSDAGDIVPFSARALPTRRLVFPLPAAGEEVVLHLRVGGVSPINLALVLWTAGEFAESQAFLQLFNGGFYGVMLFALAYNFFVFVAIRDRSYGWYVAYLALLVSLHLRLHGYAEELLGTGAAAWANLATVVLIAGVALAAAQFQRHFLDTRRRLPLYERLFRAAQILVLLALGLAAADLRWALQAVLAAALITTLVSAGAIVAAFRTGFRPARFLLVSVVCLLPSYAVTILAAFGAIEPSFFADNVNRMAAALESVLFSFALAYRIRLLEAERGAAVAELGEARRRFAADLIGRQDADRRRIAGELHDAVGQNLVVLRSRLRRLAPTGTASQDVEALDSLSAETLELVRNLSRDMHPPELERVGLAAALEAMVRRATDGTGVEARCACAIGGEDIVAAERLHCYRIAQEAVTNALKHGAPRRIDLALARAGADYRLEIRDDGGGAAAKEPAAGLGLTGMRERARLMGGTLTIVAEPGGGTRIRLSWPARQP
jgi:signal transduction histidine kinase